MMDFIFLQILGNSFSDLQQAGCCVDSNKVSMLSALIKAWWAVFLSVAVWERQSNNVRHFDLNVSVASAVGRVGDTISFLSALMETNDVPAVWEDVLELRCTYLVPRHSSVSAVKTLLGVESTFMTAFYSADPDDECASMWKELLFPVRLAGGGEAHWTQIPVISLVLTPDSEGWSVTGFCKWCLSYQMSVAK